MTGRRGGSRAAGRRGGRKRSVGYRAAQWREDKARTERRYAYRTPEYYKTRGYSDREAQHLSNVSKRAHHRH